MRQIKWETWIQQLAICCFIFFIAAICYGTDTKDTAKTYKINPLPSPAPEPDPQDEPRKENKAAASTTVAREIVFVLDNSGSMKKNDPDRITKEVVAGFIKNMTPGSRLGMVIFDTEAKVLKPLTEISGEDVDGEFIGTLTRLDYRGQQTNTPTGIERAIYELKARGDTDADKMIILLTDGLIDTGDAKRDAESERWLKEDLTSQCRQLGIKIFGIAFTDKADFRLMQMLASKTDGEYFRVYRPEEIQSVFDSINDRLARLSSAKAAAQIASRSGQTAADGPTPSGKTHNQPLSSTETYQPLPKMPTLRTEPSSPGQTVTAPGIASGKSLIDTLLIFFLIAVILVVLFLLLFMFKNNRGKTGGSIPVGGKREASTEPRPDVQAELIDVEHIIPQDSISLAIDKSSVSIGRDSHNDIVIPEKVVSSLHATITYRNGQYYLEDNRSTNGTRLNNTVIDQNNKIKLKSGDIIHFAKCEFRFLVHDQAPYGETMLIEAD